MTYRTKHIVFLCLAITLMALLLLSTSLSNMRLQPGTPFPGAAGEDGGTENTGLRSQVQSDSLFVLEGILGICLLIGLIYVPIRLIGRINIRNTLGLVAALLLVIGLLSVLPRILPGRPVAMADDLPPAASVPSFEYPVSPLEDPPNEFIWLAAGGLMLGASLIVVQLLKRTPKRTPAADALAEQAEKALHDLKAGADFPNVIIRCYLQMTEVLRTEQRIERLHSMTVREFQDWLEYKGIPPHPIQQLTALFEKARYSKEQIDSRDEAAGAECLRQIVRYCRKGSAESPWTS